MKKIPTSCILCGEMESPTVTISNRGRCRPCAAKRMSDFAEQMKAKSGPEYDRWLERLLAGGPAQEQESSP